MIGHSFDNWYSEAELIMFIYLQQCQQKNITFYAKWNVNQYTIKL